MIDQQTSLSLLTVAPLLMQETSTLPAEKSFPLSCAWCLVEQSLPLGSGSHGICSAHAEQLRQQAKARRKEVRS
jgi:hypothetical protein